MRLHLQMIVMKKTMPHIKEREKLSFFWDNSRVEFVIPLRAEMLFDYSTKQYLRLVTI